MSPQRSQVRLFKGVLHDATVLCRGTKSSISTHHPLLQATLYGVLWLLPPSCSLLTWLASGTSPSLNTLTHTYTHPYYPLHPKATFSEMLPGHTAKSHPPLLPPLFLCLCLPILICMKSTSISISILYLNIITYIKFICFLIDSVSLVKKGTLYSNHISPTIGKSDSPGWRLCSGIPWTVAVRVWQLKLELWGPICQFYSWQMGTDGSHSTYSFHFWPISWLMVYITSLSFISPFGLSIIAIMRKDPHFDTSMLNDRMPILSYLWADLALSSSFTSSTRN